MLIELSAEALAVRPCRLIENASIVRSVMTGASCINCLVSIGALYTSSWGRM